VEPRPVLVIHGVGNRGKQEQFRAEVRSLGAQFAGQLDLIDVFWGDLGADEGHIPPTLPDVDEVRGEDLSPRDEPVGLELLQGGALETRDGPVAMDVVMNAAAGPVEVRDAAARVPIGAAFGEVWPELRWLPHVSDEEILRAVGELVAEAATAPAATPSAGFDVRDGIEVRGPGEVVKKILHRVDDLVGAVIGRVGGELNHSIRSTFAPKFAGFLGDIFAYLDGKEQIYERIRGRIAERAPGFGTRERPIGAVAHSLGGVILFDLAVAKEGPIHLDGFVTFGSQAPLFHVISRRSEVIDKFTGSPVTLPETVRGKWINLWEPLDFLAFVAGRIFCLPDGSSPDDRMVAHVVGSGLWTHSAYWKLPGLSQAIRDAFAAGPLG
jgi:hypothetical protein